ALRLCAFADRSAFSADALEVSRFSCMLFLDVPGSSTTPRPVQISSISSARSFSRASKLLPTSLQGVDLRIFKPGKGRTAARSMARAWT
ncbi:MAG: hypothetical protein ABIZ80_07610, partial [Bryobacteraceae bacterium]